MSEEEDCRERKDNVPTDKEVGEILERLSSLPLVPSLLTRQGSMNAEEDGAMHYIQSACPADRGLSPHRAQVSCPPYFSSICLGLLLKPLGGSVITDAGEGALEAGPLLTSTLITPPRINPPPIRTPAPPHHLQLLIIPTQRPKPMRFGLRAVPVAQRQCAPSGRAVPKADRQTARRRMFNVDFNSSPLTPCVGFILPGNRRSLRMNPPDTRGQFYANTESLAGRVCWIFTARAAPGDPRFNGSSLRVDI
ncbi:unnamed protein product [Pleuronectes platessa]|uniref:Uncharacterized protein n=1 Tax=Pleuronectes platessa TaxID=8262 RepID=A0A9N7Y779_PLEPL|nr:unnamed protein product [Pleuronectes platessa]